MQNANEKKKKARAHMQFEANKKKKITKKAMITVRAR